MANFAHAERVQNNIGPDMKEFVERLRSHSAARRGFARISHAPLKGSPLMRKSYHDDALRERDYSERLLGRVPEHMETAVTREHSRVIGRACDRGKFHLAPGRPAVG